MLTMVIVDESRKAFKTLETLFHDEFLVSSITPDEFPVKVEGRTCGPHLVLFVSKDGGQATASKVEEIRSKWPKSAVLLLLPTLHSEEQLGCSTIRAHKILFNPCTKKRVIDAVDNYLTLLNDDVGPTEDNVLLSTLVEFAGENQPELYIAYNRIMPMITTMCGKISCDWRHIQKIFTIYVLLLSNIDQKLVEAIMHGEGRNAKNINAMYVHIQKMVDLLQLNPVTQPLAPDLMYVLKRYDGDGVPKDDVKEQEIPVASRIIRILLDYHYLLQAGKSTGQALFILNQRKGWYDYTLLQAFIDTLGDAGKQCVREVYPLGLIPGMEVAEDVYGFIDGKRHKILARNEILTDNAVDYIQRHAEDILDITEPVKIIEELFCREGGAHV
ncbi:HD domain-containing phosphohydrolase [Pseudodesulfovibrio sp. zrk46]|uniref:HD domain-containing phosphohydrolase n=1 Tax=Pseudodesulfovibrio sp. zrk46 TaxID=2725288 RepID=UPI001449CB86|nr:HD domain-containing phosphohydrolase [Pseudodesulfovibrio sp. zrk46]QJB56048.1 hypothetical protein HFN16_06320 [Pseudodesulfovibrio sp. zrk46]